MLCREKTLCFDGMMPQMRDILLSATMLYMGNDKITIEQKNRFLIACVLDMESHLEELQKKELGAETPKDNGSAERFHFFINMIGGWNAFRVLFSDKPNKNFRDDVQLRVTNGLVAGYTFKYAARNRVSRQEAARIVAESQQEAMARIEQQGLTPEGKLRQEDSIIANIWPRYKHVAHLWAALTHFAPDSLLTGFPFFRFDFFEPRNGTMEMPSFAEFIMITNEYRELGVSFCPSNTKEPLLDPRFAPLLSWESGEYFKSKGI